MVRDSQRDGFIVTVSDHVILLSALPLAAWIRGFWPGDDVTFLSSLYYTLASLCGGVLAWWLARPDKVVWQYGRWLDAVSLALVGLSGPFLGLLVGFSIDRLASVPRSVPLIQAALIVGWFLTSRALIAQRQPSQVASYRRTVEIGSHLGRLIVGDVTIAAAYLRANEAIGTSGLPVMGILVSDKTLIGRFVRGVQIIGSFSDCQRLRNELTNHGVRITQIVLTSDLSSLTEVELRTIDHLKRDPSVKLIDFHNAVVPPSDVVSEIGSDYEDIEKQFPVTFAAKRAFDFVVSVTAFLALLPAFGIVSVLLKFALPGEPVLFWQWRPGQFGRPFKLYKYRTLSPLLDPRSGAPRSLSERQGGIGRLIRQLRLDEFPQLWSIIVGDMSFVGPRPLLHSDQPADHRRLSIKPGLTGWAQVNGGATLTPDEKNALDLFYLRRVGPLMDLKILLLTLLRWRGSDRARPLVIQTALDEFTLPISRFATR
jgi:lipopolysaccharide/colanic/teichoic acid biosynthesis glycosyltransferase